MWRISARIFDAEHRIITKFSQSFLVTCMDIYSCIAYIHVYLYIHIEHIICVRARPRTGYCIYFWLYDQFMGNHLFNFINSWDVCRENPMILKPNSCLNVCSIFVLSLWKFFPIWPYSKLKYRIAFHEPHYSMALGQYHIEYKAPTVGGQNPALVGWWHFPCSIIYRAL